MHLKLLYKDMDRLIDRLLQLNYKVVYRSSPSNLNEKKGKREIIINIAPTITSFKR